MFTFPLRADFDQARCNVVSRAVYNLIAGRERYQGDLDRESEWFYPGRLKEMVSSTDPKDLWKVFSEVSPEDLIELYHAMEGGYLKIFDDKNAEGRRPTKAEEQFIWDLYTFGIQDTDHGLWVGNTMQARAVAIQEKLNQIYPEKGYDAGMEKASDDAIKAVNNTEKNLLTRAVTTKDPQSGEKLPGTGWWKQLFFPLNPRMKKVKAVNDTLRDELQHAQAVDEVILIATLQRAKELGLTPEQIQGMRWLIAQTAGQTAQVREKIAKIFGLELSHRDGEPVTALDPYAIYERAKDFDEKRDTREYQIHGERELDRMEATINQARKKLGQGSRPMSDFFDKELQIRHIEMDRRTPEARDAHNETLHRNSSEHFVKHYEWTEIETYTETETVSDGNGGTTTQVVMKTRTVTKSGSTDHYPTYSEILSGEIDTSAPQGSLTNPGSVRAAAQDILERSAPTRKIEQPYWYSVHNIESGLLNHIENHASTLEGGDKTIKPAIQELEAWRKDLEKELPGLKKYAESSEKVAMGRWNGEDFQDFQDRTRRLIQRYQTVMRYLDIYTEQLRRKEAVLTLPYVNPEYPEQFSVLEKKHFNATVIKTLGALGILGGIGGGVYAYNQGAWPFNQGDGGDDDEEKKRRRRWAESEEGYSQATPPSLDRQKELSQKWNALQPLLGVAK